MGRGKPLSPCPFAGGRENPADLRVGYLHAHLPEGVKTLPISAWEKEYTALKAQREAEYETLKDTRAEVAELQKIRKCVDIALRADQPAQTQSRTKRQEQER